MQESLPQDKPIAEPMTIIYRAKYFAGAAVSIGGATGLLGAGMSGGALLGLIAGAGAAIFSPEIRGAFVDHLPAPQGAESRPSKVRWFLTGEVEDETEQEDQPDASQEDEMEELQPRTASVQLPLRSPAFREMRHLMRPDVDVLGFDGERFVSAASFKQAVNIAVIGVPGAGKTVCLSFHVAQSLSRRAIVRGWDIHGDVASDLGECCTILEDVDEIVADCDWIQLEREHRLEARKIAKSQGKEALQRWHDSTRELVYIIDEFNALMLRLKRRKKDREIVADTLLSLIAEGRKLKMRVILSGQTMPAALFGDQGSSARDIINTKYAFQSRENHAQYFGVEASAVDALLPLIAGGDSVGYAILDGGGLLHARIVSIPYVTIEDIRSIVREIGSDLDEDEDIIASLMARRQQQSVHTENVQPYRAKEIPQSAPVSRRDAAPHLVVRVPEGTTQQRRMERLHRQHKRGDAPEKREQAHGEVEISLQEAYRLWSAGNDNIRDLAKALNTTNYQASKLYTAMVDAKMIEPKKKVVVRD